MFILGKPKLSNLGKIVRAPDIVYRYSASGPEAHGCFSDDIIRAVGDRRDTNLDVSFGRSLDSTRDINLDVVWNVVKVIEKNHEFTLRNFSIYLS